MQNELKALLLLYRTLTDEQKKELMEIARKLLQEQFSQVKDPRT